MKEGKCSAEVGFVFSDVLTNLERVSDHCSNIAGCVLDNAKHNLNMHETLRLAREQSPLYREYFDTYCEKYAV